MRRASNPHTQPYVNVRRQRHAAGSHGRLYTAGAMRHEAESRSPPRSKSSLCVTVIRQAQRQRHASGVRRHAPCASLERHSQSSKSGVKIMRQRHASESQASFMRRGHSPRSTSSIHVVRHTSRVMGRTATSCVAAMRPSLKSPHSQPSFSESQSTCGAPRQGQAPRSYLIVLVKAKATAVYKLMRRRFAVAVRATSTPSETCVNVRVMRRLPGGRVRRQPS